jgi:cob(I)alamin adenosyltransferase
MRITKVYTRTGDAGQTRLVGGAEVPKDEARIEAYGTVDELNAVLGIIRAFLREGTPAHQRLDPMLGHIQDDLFNVGTELATPADARWEGMYRPGADEVARLEQWIDGLNDELEPLKEFVLPGGGVVGAHFHQARTVCRRAERRAVTLMREDPEVEAGPMRVLNRLSDWLFVAGRWVAHAEGHPETLWRNPSRRSR